MGSSGTFCSSVPFLVILAASAIFLPLAAIPPPPDKPRERPQGILDVKELQDVSGLPNISCEHTLAFEGQSDELLDTSSKKKRIESAFSMPELALYSMIKNSPDFDVSIFTKTELDNLLTTMGETIKSQQARRLTLQPTTLKTVTDPDQLNALLALWTPAYRLLQKPSVMCEVNEMIPLTAFGAVCDHLGDFSTTVKQMAMMEGRCAHCTAYFMKQRDQEKMTGIFEGGKGHVLYKIIREGFSDDWDLYMLRFDPGSVKADDILKIDPSSFTDIEQLKVLENKKNWIRFDKRVMAALGRALLSAHGPVGTWPPSKLKKLGQYIMSLSPAKLDEILTPQMFFDIEMDLVDLPMSDTYFSTGAWKVVDYFKDGSKKAEFDGVPGKKKLVCLILKYAPMKSLFETLITMDVTTEALTECQRFKPDYSKLTFLIKKAAQEPDFEWSGDAMLEMDALMPLLPSSMLEDITDDELKKYWINKNSAFDFPLMKTIWKRLKPMFKSPQKPPCLQFQDLKEAILILTKKELDAFPLVAFTNCASDFVHHLNENCHYNPRTCEYIWMLIKRASKKTGKPILELLQMMDSDFIENFIPPEDMLDIDLDVKNGADDDFSDLSDVPMDGVLAKFMYCKIKKKYGNLTEQTRGMANKRDALKLFGKGSTVEDLQDLPEDGSLMNILPEISDGVGKDNRKKTSVVYDKVHHMLGLDKKRKNDVCIDEGMAKDLAGFFTQASIEDLEKLRPESKKDILKTIGDNGDYVKQMSRPRLRSFFKVQKNATGLKDTDDIGPAIIEDIGPQLLCGMTKEDSKKLTAESVSRYINLIDDCDQLDQDTRGKMASKYVSDKGGLKELLKSPVQMKKMGSLLAYVDVPMDLNEDEKDKLKFMSEDVQARFSDRQKRLEGRSDRDIPDDEKNVEKSKRNMFNQKLLRLDSKDNDDMDCNSLRKYDGDMGFLGTDDLRKMKSSEFKDCLETFHDTDWDKSQRRVIRSKLKKLYGDDMSAWTSNIMMQVGPLIKSFEPREIFDLEFTGDIVAYLGQFDIGAEGARSVIDKYLNDSVIANISDITADILGSFGKLLCGFTPEKIRKLDSTVIKEASYHFREADCLETDQLESLMDKLEEELGSDWSDFAPEDIEELGILMGGASEEILTSLQEQQMASVNSKAFDKMPAKKFARAFTAEKLQQLSDEQAIHLKPDHIWRMDKRQREAIANFTEKAGFSVPKAKHLKKRISSQEDFQNGRRLPRASCESSLAFAGQKDDLLDTTKKTDAFARTLSGKKRQFFQKLLDSDDHDVNLFTDLEMESTLDFLMESISDEEREDFLDIVENFEYISSDSLQEMIEEWPPSIHLLQKPEVMCEVTSRLDEDLLTSFCERITDSEVTVATTSEIIERCPDCVILRYIMRENFMHIPPLDEAKASVVMRKFRQWRPADWDLYTLAIAPGALKPKDIDRITNIGHFRNESQLEVFTDDDVMCCLKDGVLRKIAKRLHEALGPIASWSEEIFEKVGHFIPHLPNSISEAELTGDFVMSNLNHMEPGEDMSEEEEKAFTIAARNLANQMASNRKSLRKDQIMKALCFLAKFPPKQSVFDTIFTADNLKEGLSNCSEWNIDKEMSSRALSKVVNSPGHLWDSKEIQLMRDFSSGVTPDLIDSIDKNTLSEKWEEIKEAKFSIFVLRSAWNKLKENFTLTTADCDDIKMMGRMFFALSMKEINDIPSATIGECAGYLSKIMGQACEEDRRVCDKTWEKVCDLASRKKDTKSKIIKTLDQKFLRYVPSADLKNVSLDDLGGIDKISEMDLDETQAEAIMEIVEREKGPVSRKNLNYAGRDIEKLGEVLFKGASVENLSELPEGTELLESLPQMKKKIKSMDDKKVDAIYGKVRTMFGLDSDTPVCLDESTITQTAGFFTRASREDLKKLNDVTRKSVQSEIGKDADLVKTMSRKSIREHFQVLKETENFDTKNEIVSDEMDTYGPSMFCGMMEKDVDKLSIRVLEDNIAKLDDCLQLDQDTRKKVAGRIVSASNGFTGLVNKPDKLKSMGSFLMYVDLPDPSSITNDQKETMKSVVNDVMEKVNKRKKRQKDRADTGIPQSEKTEEAVQGMVLADHLWKFVSDAADCQTLRSFGDEPQFLTVGDINVMESNDITACLDVFQNVDLDLESQRAIGKKIKEEFGNNTRNWSKDRIMRTGKLIAGLDSDDIDKMTLDTDILGVIGQSKVLEPKKIFRKFKKDNGIANMSTVDSNTLREFGKILCAIESDELEDIQDDVIKDAIKEFGKADCLNDKQVEVIGKKFQKSVSDEELKDLDMGNIGLLAGGLSEDKLKQLDGNQLSKIPAKAIGKMKPETFTATFTPEKMSKLSKEQVTALDPKVLRKMKVNQLIALDNVSKGKKKVNATEEARNKKSRFQIELPQNVSIKSIDTFKEVRNLPQDNCAGVSFAGQSDNLLDTKSKRDAFKGTLHTSEAVFFERILASNDHDVSKFTTFEMRKMLQFILDDLSSQGQDSFINLKTAFGSIPPEILNVTIRTWSPNIYLIMKPNLMCDTFGKMDVESLTMFCERLTFRDVSTATFIEILNRCGDCLAIAHAERTSETIISMMSGFKGKAFYDKLRQWKRSGWDIYHLMFAPDALEKGDIDRITDLDNFKDMGQLLRLADYRFFKMVPQAAMEAIARKLHQALGSFSLWSFIEKHMLLPYIINMPPKILRSDIEVGTVLSILPNINDIIDVAGEKFLTISAWKLAKYLIRRGKSVPRDVKEEAMCLVLKYTNHKALWNNVYSASDVLARLPDCGSYDIPEKRLANLMKKLVKSDSFEWDQDGIDMLGEFIAAVPKNILKRVDPNLLYANWESLSNSDFGLNKLRMLWKRIRRQVDLSTLTCADLQKLGKVFFIFHSKDLKTIPDTTIGECVGYIGEMLKDSCKENKWFCKRVWDKIKAFAVAESLAIGKLIHYLGEDFLKFLPKSDIETIDIDDLGGIDSLDDLKMDQDHAPILMRKVKTILGPVRMNNANFSAEAVMKMGSIFYYGASSSDYEVLPEDSSLLEMLPHLAKFFNNLNEKKIEVVFLKLKKIFGVDTTSNICLDRALAEQIAMFFIAARADDIRKFSDDTKKVIFQTLGQKYDYVKRMSRQKIQELFSVLMEINSLGSKSSYDEEDVGKYGYMWCGQQSPQAIKMGGEAVDGYMGLFKDCVHFKPDTRESLVKRSISVSGGLSDMLTINPKRLEDLGSMILDIDVNELKGLDSDAQEVFVTSTEKIMESVTRVQKEAKKRPSADISEEDKISDAAKLKKVGRAIFDMHLASPDTKRRRRKRAASTIDCPTIRNFNGALSFLTASDIDSIANEEFEDCLAEFQSIVWDDSQLGSFKTQLIAIFGSDTSSWTQDNVLAAGILLDSLESSHILSLQVLDDDTISTLGTNVFAKNAPHIMTSYMTNQNISDLSTVSTDTLGNVGNLVCGFNTTQIAGMESSTINGASSDLSSVTCLEPEQLTTLGNKIVEIRGTDWTSSTSDEISSLGILAGGLPASVLEDLGNDQIASIAPEAIEDMDPGTFAAVFTADKIKSLSSTQANSLTSDHRAQLSAEQLSAVQEVATTAADDENGTSGLSSSLMMMAIVLVVITLNSMQ